MKSNTYRHYNNYNDYYVFIVIKQKFLKDKFLVEDIGINETVLENLQYKLEKGKSNKIHEEY